MSGKSSLVDFNWTFKQRIAAFPVDVLLFVFPSRIEITTEQHHERRFTLVRRT
jgi:hypothetical protein